jgi:hypothetical protein
MDLKSSKAKDLTKNDVFRELKQYLAEQISLSTRKSLSEDNFTLPAWSEFQAYQLGFQKAFSKLDELIPNPDQGDK